MKKSVFKISGLAACAVFMFSCASSGKVSKQSFGGNWNETVATKTTSPSSPAVVETSSPALAAVETASVNQEVATTETPKNAVSTPAAKKQQAQTANFSVKEKVGLGNYISGDAMCDPVFCAIQYPMIAIFLGNTLHS